MLTLLYSLSCHVEMPFREGTCVVRVQMASVEMAAPLFPQCLIDHALPVGLKFYLQLHFNRSLGRYRVMEIGFS